MLFDCRYTRYSAALHGKADMPLIVLCGQPSCGKSIVTSLIEQQLQQQEKAVTVISEQTLHQERNLAYQGVLDWLSSRCMMYAADDAHTAVV